MKTIIAGSRSIHSYRLVKEAIRDSGFEITEIVSGHAKGADHWGELYAQQNNIDLAIFPANWGKYGKGAGHVRNRKMAEYSEALIAIWDGKSMGTANMIRVAREYGLEIFIYKVEQS